LVKTRAGISCGVADEGPGRLGQQGHLAAEDDFILHRPHRFWQVGDPRAIDPSPLRQTLQADQQGIPGKG
jgi:hypothetical protein